MPLAEAELDREYDIREITSEDADLVKFLFSLGCYSGEKITVLNRKKNKKMGKNEKFSDTGSRTPILWMKTTYPNR